MSKEGSIPKLSLSPSQKSLKEPAKDPSPTSSGPSKSDMLRKISTSPRQMHGSVSPSSPPPLPKGSHPSSPSASPAPEKKGSRFGKKKELSEQSIPSSLPRKESVSKVGGRSQPTTPSGVGELDHLVWANVVADSGASGEEVPVTRSRGFSRSRTRRKSSNAESDSEDTTLGGVVALEVKRGQMVLLLEIHSKSCIGFCGGSVGRIDRAAVKVVDGTAAPQCPAGDSDEDAEGLAKVFCMNNFHLVQLFLDSLPNSSANAFSTFLLELLNHKDTDWRGLLQLLIKQEVKNTAEHQMLFRGNTVASKVLSQFAKLVGTKYLDVLLRPLIRSTALMGHEIVDFVEFDPSAKNARSVNQKSAKGSREDEEKDVEWSEFLKSGGTLSDEEVRETSEEERDRIAKNSQVAMSVWQSTEMLMEVLFQSFGKVPPALRIVAFDMKVLTEPKFVDYHLVLAGFFVLRFVAPAVAAPTSFSLDCLRGIDLSAEMKKRLLQVSKIIQAVANNVAFKESSHLDCLNDNVAAANVQLQRFFDQFVTKDAAAVMPDDSWKRGGHDKTTMTSFWKFCIESLPVVGRRVLASESPADSFALSRLVDCLSGLPMSNGLK